MGYLFSVIPPFLDSISNYLDKILLSKYSITPTVLAIYSGIFAFFSSLIVVLFIGIPIIDIKTALIIIFSGIFGVLILQTYYYALTLDEASRVASLFQVIPVMILILSYIFLDEKLLPKQYIGSLFVITAGFLFSLHRKSKSFVLNKAFVYMILASFFSAMVYILFRVGAKEVGFWNALPYEGLGNGISALFILLYKNNLQLTKDATREISKTVFIYVTIIELSYRLSRLSLFFALSLLAAPIVSLLQGLQPVFLLIIGIILSLWMPHILKEVITKETITIKIVAIIGIFIGFYLIFL